MVTDDADASTSDEIVLGGGRSAPRRREQLLKTLKHVKTGIMVDDVPNPFRPTFGASPPVLAGRDEVLAGFRYALEEGAGSPGMASLYVGPRGSGKTVVLNQIEDMASQAGWSVIAENAGAGLVRRLVAEHLPTLLSRADPDATSWR